MVKTLNTREKHFYPSKDLNQEPLIIKYRKTETPGSTCAPITRKFTSKHADILLFLCSLHSIRLTPHVKALQRNSLLH